MTKRQHRTLFSLLVLLLISLALFWPYVSATFKLAWQSDDYTHILLVLPVSGLLIWLEGKRLLLGPQTARRPARLLVAASVLVAAAGWLSRFAGLGQNLTLQMSLLVVLWIALFVCFYGVGVSQKLLFPLLFLLFLIPLPSTWLDHAITFLQSASTEGTWLLFKSAGIPVLKNGFVLSLSSLDIEVAKECSGIRSSEILLLTCLVLGHLFLTSFWRQLVFACSVVPIAIAKNAVRIFTISMLGVHVNPGFLHGNLHRNGGFVFFAMGLGFLMGLLWVLQKTETRRDGRSL